MNVFFSRVLHRAKSDNYAQETLPCLRSNLWIQVWFSLELCPCSVAQISGLVQLSLFFSLCTASSEICGCIFIPFSGSHYFLLLINPTRPFQFWDQAIRCFSSARLGHIWKCSAANHWSKSLHWWRFRCQKWVGTSRASHKLNDSEIFELRCLTWQMWLDVILMPSCFVCESILKSLSQFWKGGQAHE